jgi:hypothetical protein
MDFIQLIELSPRQFFAVLSGDELPTGRERGPASTR